jgi:haloacetate dehalogenase
MADEGRRWFEGFEARLHALDGSVVMARTGGRAGAPPLLLLHGFPQTHVMWHRVASALRDDFALVLPDLRGYGDSARPPTTDDHAPYAKRAMARDLVALMRSLGHERFFVCGHDRGARVAARMALDHPGCVARLCLMDIAPTLDMYASAGFDFGRLYHHWFHLIQPTPLPEQMIGGWARPYLHTMLGGWGGQGLGHVEPQALAEYERCFCRPEAIHSACEDYRASAGIDLEHDRASRAAGQRIACELRVLWGARGVIERLYDPLVLWSAQCSARTSGRAMAAGHFIPEELPDETAQELRGFFHGG